jgi:hypothetical protein
MKRLFILLLMVPFFASAQYVVKESGHEIITNDSIAERTLKEFFYEADRARVDYTSDLRKLKEVRAIVADKTFIASQKDGVLLFNAYLNKYPNTKRIVVLHLIGLHYGLKGTKGSSYKVMNEHFIMNDRTEYIYTNRRTLRLDIKDLIAQLENVRPLNTLVNKK